MRLSSMRLGPEMGVSNADSKDIAAYLYTLR